MVFVNPSVSRNKAEPVRLLWGVDAAEEPLVNFVNWRHITKITVAMAQEGLTPPQTLCISTPMTNTEKLYTVALTAEQLRTLSQLIGAAEIRKLDVGLGPLDGVETEVFWKVSDKMDEMYADFGIED